MGIVEADEEIKNVQNLLMPIEGSCTCRQHRNPCILNSWEERLEFPLVTGQNEDVFVGRLSCVRALQVLRDQVHRGVGESFPNLSRTGLVLGGFRLNNDPAWYGGFFRLSKWYEPL